VGESLAAARLLSSAIRYRLAAVGAALLGMGSRMGFRQHAKGRGENLPGRNLPNLVGNAYGLVDLPIAQASLSRFRDMVLDAGYAVATQCRAKRHELPFGTAEFFRYYTLPLGLDEVRVHVPNVADKQTTGFP
jgi:hypothetical protein